MGTGWSQRERALSNTNNQNAKVDVSTTNRLRKLFSNKVNSNGHIDANRGFRSSQKRDEAAVFSCWNPFNIKGNNRKKREKLSLVHFPTSKKPPLHPSHSSARAFIKPIFPKSQRLTFSEKTSVIEFNPRPPSEEQPWEINPDELQQNNDLESVGNSSIYGADDNDRMARSRSRGRESDKVIVYPYAANPKTPRDPVLAQETHDFTYYCLPDLPTTGKVSSLRRVRPASPGWSINTINTTVTMVNRTPSWKSSLESLNIYEAQIRQKVIRLKRDYKTRLFHGNVPRYTNNTIM